ncbi:hypothetical protein TNCV_4428141 [Trichonephila clavipes]|nr:hypothetical protein TNCV_4428141 [Trichonephila clavipes]
MPAMVGYLNHWATAARLISDVLLSVRCGSYENEVPAQVSPSSFDHAHYPYATGGPRHLEKITSSPYPEKVRPPLLYNMANLQRHLDSNPRLEENNTDNEVTTIVIWLSGPLDSVRLVG